MQDTASGPTAAIAFFVTNAGTGSLDLGVPHMGGVWWHEFSLNMAGMQLQLAAGQSTSFTVAFDPTTVGQRDALIRFAHTDTSQASPFYGPVTGNGTGTAAPPPAMSLEHAGTPITTPDYYVGTVPVQTPTSHTFTIRNSGGGDLFLQGPEYVDVWATAGCSAVVSAIPAAVISPGTSGDMTIDVTPSGPYSWFYMIRIISNDGSYMLTVEGDVPVVPTQLQVVTQPGGATASAAFGTLPVVAVTDALGAVDTANNTTVVQASITSGTGAAGAVLGGSTAVTVSNGYAIFADLEIDLPGAGYTLEFLDASGTLAGTTSGLFDIASAGSSGTGGSHSADEGCSPSTQASGLAPVLLILAFILQRRRKHHRVRR